MGWQNMTKYVHIGGVIFPNETVDLSATKTDEKIEKNMTTGQSGTRWPYSKR